MDLISIESQSEQNSLGAVMKAGNVREVWTSGRLCDKEVDGCDQPRFQPYNIRGWFWAATLQSMGETNVFNGRRVGRQDWVPKYTFPHFSSMDGPTLALYRKPSLMEF